MWNTRERSRKEAPCSARERPARGRVYGYLWDNVTGSGSAPSTPHPLFTEVLGVFKMVPPTVYLLCLGSRGRDPELKESGRPLDSGQKV